ncbi:MAG: sensor histidine kinase [Beutenbergiaceae bacterium]
MTSISDGARVLLPPPLQRLGLWAWAIVGGLALVVLVLGLSLGTGLYGIPFGAAFLGTALQSGSLLLGLVRARLAAVLHVIGLIIVSSVASHDPWPWPASVVSTVALEAMLLLLTTATRWWLSLATWLAACMSLTVIASLAGTGNSQVLGNLIVTVSLSVGALIIGLLLTLWWRASRDLGDARDQAQQEVAARQWVEERARVAREMHDVVAHSMSLVHMRATSAQYRIPDLTSAAVAEFDGIAVQAREALGQMRGVLSVLRGDDQSQMEPLPGFAQLPDLVAGARAADIDITATIAQIEPEPDPSVQLALYRVAQEAIANVVRHAPHSSVTLELEDAVQISLRVTSLVTDDLGPGDDSTQVSRAPDHGGMGIRGMMERMMAIGGTVQAGPILGGFEVLAHGPRAAR